MNRRVAFVGNMDASRRKLTINNSIRKCYPQSDAPSQDLLGLVLGIKSLRRVLVRQHVIPFILRHDSRRVSFATSLIRDTPRSFTRISMVHSPRIIHSRERFSTARTIGTYYYQRAFCHATPLSCVSCSCTPPKEFVIRL